MTPTTIIAIVCLTALLCVLAALAGLSDGLKGFVHVAAPALASLLIYVVYLRVKRMYP
jgi:hypothetical protein